LYRGSLDTRTLSVAKMRLADFIKDKHRQLENQKQVADGKLRFGDAIRVGESRRRANSNLKPRTRDYTRSRCRRSWPTLDGTEIRKITQTACLDWASRWEAWPVLCTAKDRSLVCPAFTAIDRGGRVENSGAEKTNPILQFKASQSSREGHRDNPRPSPKGSEVHSSCKRFSTNLFCIRVKAVCEQTFRLSRCFPKWTLYH
jgi:hypothetical protein